MPDDSEGMTPGVAGVYEQIRSRIAQGVYAPGDALPASNSMATRYGVSRQAVQRAVRKLVDEGWLATRPGKSPVVQLRQAPPTSLLAGTILPVSDAQIH